MSYSIVCYSIKLIQDSRFRQSEILLTVILTAVQISVMRDSVFMIQVNARYQHVTPVLPTTGTSVPVQSSVAPATMSEPSVSKIPSVCTDMLIFFQIASLGHTDTDAVPLACQEKGYHNIVHFGLLSDAEWKIGFQDYDTNGDGTGNRLPISLGVQNQIKPAIAYCRFCLSNSSDPDRISPQCWDKDEYNKFYYQF